MVIKFFSSGLYSYQKAVKNDLELRFFWDQKSHNTHPNPLIANSLETVWKNNFEFLTACMSIIMTSSNKMSKQIFFVYCSVEMNFKTLWMHGGFLLMNCFPFPDCNQHLVGYSSSIIDRKT